MTNRERTEDLLTEYDEFDMQPMILVPDPLDKAIAWKQELTYAIEHLEAEIARAIFEEIESRLLNHIADYYGCYHKTFDELKKKYTGE